MNDLTVTPLGYKCTYQRSIRAIAENVSASLEKNCLLRILLKKFWPWLMPNIPRMMASFSGTSPKKRWRESMRIDGEWLLCDDDIVRPVIRGEILAHDGSWQAIEFLVDTGADRTV